MVWMHQIGFALNDEIVIIMLICKRFLFDFSIDVHESV